MNCSSYAKLLRRLRNWPFSPYAGVYFIDLHDLRTLNRTGFAHVADAVLSVITDTLGHWAGDSGIACRLWGDEFIATRVIDHPQDAVDHALDLRSRLLSQSLPGPLGDWRLSLAIGVVATPPDADWGQVIQRAGLACDHARSRGRNQISSHVPADPLSPAGAVNPDFVEQFRRLLAAGHLAMHPQPIMSIGPGEPRLAKAEFLCRMEKNGSFVPLPRGMIETLEAFDAAAELDRFASGAVISWLQENPVVLERVDNISINLSGKSIADGQFMYKLFHEVRGAGLPQGKLTFEITETTAIQQLAVAAEAIAEFKALGCGFSLDDFGSGLCSFGYLQSLAVDEVKIDGRFVREIATNPAMQEIVRAINQVAHATGKKTVAEFVDEAAKLEVLRRIGVDYAQGWLFYPTVTPDRLLELLQANVHSAAA